MPDTAEDFNGAMRAAVFLLSLGEDAAANVLQHIEPRHVQRVGLAMAELNTVSSDNLSKVIQDFLQTLSTESAVGIIQQVMCAQP